MAMSPDELLKKAIEKAIPNGWKVRMGRAYEEYWPPKEGFKIEEITCDQGWDLSVYVTQPNG